MFTTLFGWFYGNSVLEYYEFDIKELFYVISYDWYPELMKWTGFYLTTA